ncbi:hypothetical protein SSTG_05557 [Streptomyces sp. e14]|nr:hypothetical protein SSTG_05557 [Streptomyces sp. e14]
MTEADRRSQVVESQVAEGRNTAGGTARRSASVGGAHRPAL